MKSIILKQSTMKRIIIFLLLAIPIISFAQEKATWDYPVKPGSKKWSSLETENDRIKAMQIPIEILNNMQPEEFAKLIANFPLFGYYTAFNTPQEGFNIMFSRFNIYQKLCEKNNISRYLIDIYKDAELSGWKSKSKELTDEYWTLKFNYIEYLLSQEEFILNLNISEKKELIKEAKNKLIQKAQHKSFNSLSGIGATVLIISRVLQNENELDKTLLNNAVFQSFIKTGYLGDERIVEDVLYALENYLNKK